MNGRLLALLGAIALFVCLWSAPERKRPEAAPVQIASAESPKLPAAMRDAPAFAPRAAPTLSDPPELETILEPEWLGDPLLSRLPTGLLPGVYRVVSTDGAVGLVDIHGTVLGANPQELFTHREGRTTWYFIRQADDAVGRSPVSEPGAARAPPAPIASPADEECLIPFHAEDDEPVLPELTSKDRDILEAQLRQWLKGRALQARDWVLQRL